MEIAAKRYGCGLRGRSRDETEKLHQCLNISIRSWLNECDRCWLTTLGERGVAEYADVDVELIAVRGPERLFCSTKR